MPRKLLAEYACRNSLKRSEEGVVVRIKIAHGCEGKLARFGTIVKIIYPDEMILVRKA
jgi:hypothetical protein